MRLESSTSRLVVVLAVGALWWFLVPYALRVGSVWHGTEHPMWGVQVQLDDQTLTGDLRQELSGNWVLSQPDGSTVRLPSSIPMVYIPKGHEKPLHYWRLWLPFFAVSLLPIFAIFRLFSHYVFYSKGDNNV